MTDVQHTYFTHSSALYLTCEYLPITLGRKHTFLVTVPYYFMHVPSLLYSLLLTDIDIIMSYSLKILGVCFIECTSLQAKR